jgi:hypothetical protein
MTDGQRALVGSADLAAVDAAITRLAVSELTRGADHAAQLRGVLALAVAQHTAGMDLATVAQVALALGCSEARAGRLLTEAQALAVLPGALEAIECGLLTVEQSSTLVNQLAVLDLTGQLVLWRRLQQRLIADNSPLPPARLTELLRRWVIAHDRQAAAERRRQAELSRTTYYRRRDDGLYDLTGAGLNPPDTHAILARIAERARPWGVDDERTADQRRLDAFRDLLLGRDQRPLQPDDSPDGHDCDAGASCARCALRAAGAAPCGCLPGQPVPCGTDTAVLLPIGAGLGTTDELAELAGHGPLEPDLNEQLLLAGPVLRPVWIDADGVVVAAGDTTIRPQRGDPAAVRAALLALQDLPPPPLQPRHPHDHRADQPADQQPPSLQTAERQRAVPTELAPVGALRRPDLPGTAVDLVGAAGGPDGPDGRTTADPLALADARVLATAALGGSGEHPPGTPGAYRPSRRLRRLIELRAPRCEWPGCGARAVRCDSEHDLAWPSGPTCACNLGPCCRRHHRVKQLGWTKTRGRRGVVTWTDPIGRSWTSPGQHQPPQRAQRPPPPIPAADPLDELSPLELEDELSCLGLLPDDLGPFTTPSRRRARRSRPAPASAPAHRHPLDPGPRQPLPLAPPAVLTTADGGRLWKRMPVGVLWLCSARPFGPLWSTSIRLADTICFVAESPLLVLILGLEAVSVDGLCLHDDQYGLCPPRGRRPQSSSTQLSRRRSASRRRSCHAGGVVSPMIRLLMSGEISSATRRASRRIISRCSVIASSTRWARPARRASSGGQSLTRSSSRSSSADTPTHASSYSTAENRLLREGSVVSGIASQRGTEASAFSLNSRMITGRPSSSRRTTTPLVSPGPQPSRSAEPSTQMVTLGWCLSRAGRRLTRRLSILPLDSPHERSQCLYPSGATSGRT